VNIGVLEENYFFEWSFLAIPKENGVTRVVNAFRKPKFIVET
jgi:hypothetical protein